MGRARTHTAGWSCRVPARARGEGGEEPRPRRSPRRRPRRRDRERGGGRRDGGWRRRRGRQRPLSGAAGSRGQRVLPGDRGGLTVASLACGRVLAVEAAENRVEIG